MVYLLAPIPGRLNGNGDVYESDGELSVVFLFLHQQLAAFVYISGMLEWLQSALWRGCLLYTGVQGVILVRHFGVLPERSTGLYLLNVGA